MSSFQKFFQTKPIDTASAVHLSFQGYAELDTQFVSMFNGILDNNWYVWNTDGYFHTLRFNKDIFHPTLSNGWQELKEFYSLPENVEVVFDYFGRSLFALKSFKKLSVSSTMPSFHSRSTIPMKTIYYDLQLNEKNINKTYLTLPQDLATHITNTISDNKITLCGDNGYVVRFNVITKKTSNELKTKIGNMWNVFTFNNSVEPGCIIRFKFTIPNPLHRCHVFKVSPN